MNPLKAVREHLEGIDAMDLGLARDRAREALDALEEVKTAYYVGRTVLMRPMVVHQAIHDWYARVDYQEKIYTASGDTAAEAIYNLSEEVFQHE